MIKILSFGGGVQTAALVAMSAHGEIERPDHIIFADPQAESQATYEYIAYFEAWLATRGMKVEKTTAGNIMEDALKPGLRFASMPVYVKTENVRGGMLTRQCTADYKIIPVRRKLRELIGIGPRAYIAPKTVELWMGISLDEAIRMKPSRVQYIEHRYPLIEKEMTRHRCIEYLKRVGLRVPPKSACIVCPFHSDSYWRDMKRVSPAEFEAACAFDEALRRHKSAIKKEPYLHRSLKPLREVVFTEHPDLFGIARCDSGFCGT